MRTIILPTMAALALVACDGRAPEAERNVTTASRDDPANADAEANATGNRIEPENALAAVLALNDRQRNGVFVRALMDAGVPCDGVTESTRLPDQDGKPLWRADCKAPGGSHMISITPEGMAQIVTRTDR